MKKDDVIFIDRNSDAIHVFGEVSKPGIYFPNIGYSLTELISTSGLNQLTANAKNIYVIREDYSKFLSIDVFQLDIRNPVSFTTGSIALPIILPCPVGNKCMLNPAAACKVKHSPAAEEVSMKYRPGPFFGSSAGVNTSINFLEPIF